VGESSVKNEIRKSLYDVMDRDSVMPLTGQVTWLLLIPLLVPLQLVGEQAAADEV
jgi:hypothetical protein